MSEQEQKAFDQMREALEALLKRDKRNTCQHEETHRGGAIWEICEGCGMKWADDRGGKPKWKNPPEWDVAELTLAAANAVSHPKPETTPSPEGGAITSKSAANAVQPQAQGEAWKPDFEHLANEWADAATNGPTILDNVRDGIYSFEKAKEMMAADFAHCREVGARVRTAANAVSHPQATEPAWIAVSDRLPEEDKRVLVWYRGHVSTTSLWRGSFITDSAEQPTHWMPLPAPPEAP